MLVFIGVVAYLLLYLTLSSLPNPPLLAKGLGQRKYISSILNQRQVLGGLILSGARYQVVR